MLKAGSTETRYKVVGLLGAGGMGKHEALVWQKGGADILARRLVRGCAVFLLVDCWDDLHAES